jgi:lipopolysaccharide transport system ATP-binding protein
MAEEILIKAKKVSKKYCKELKRSLAYGLQDIVGELNPFVRRQKTVLRKDEFWANQDISFEVRRGQCLGLIGRNGAGKSTLLKLLNGLVKPDEGRIEMHGKICALIELGAGFNPVLTGLENIYINGTVLGLSKEQIDAKLDDIIDFSEMKDFLNTPVQSYSSGMKVRLGFSVAIHLEPDILLLDEILAVGDAGFRAKCFNAITEISRNAAVIFVSHSMPNVSCVCDSIMVLKQGRKQYLGNDIGQGIECYNNLFFEGLQRVAIEGKARLRNLKINEGQTPLRQDDQIRIKGGMPVTFKIEYECNVIIHRVGFHLDFYDMNESLIAQCYSTSSGLPLVDKESGIVTTEVRFNEMPFAPGRYSVTVTCLEMLDEVRHGEIYFRVQNVERFFMINSFPGFTPVQLTADWSRS